MELYGLEVIAMKSGERKYAEITARLDNLFHLAFLFDSLPAERVFIVVLGLMMMI